MSLSGGTALLPFRPPYEWQAMLEFLAFRAIAGVEEVRDGIYRRSASIDGAAVVIEVARAEESDALLLRVPAAPGRGLGGAVERARRLLDVEAEPREINAVLAKDEALAPLVAAEPGLRVPGAWDPFELAVRAILGQQVSVASAGTSAARLAERYGEALPAAAGTVVRLFPTAARLAAADPAGMRLPRARGLAIVELARAVESGALVLQRAASLAETVARLKGLRGVGEWTAQYVAMRALGKRDAFPAGDLGLLAAARAWMPGATHADLLARAEAWRPWRAYAAVHLWRSLGGRRRPLARGSRPV